MTALKLGPQTAAYARRKVGFLSDVVERWTFDSSEADPGCEFEALLRDVTDLLGDLFALDSRVQGEYLDGRPFDPAFAAVVAGMLADWVRLAGGCERLLAEVEGRGHAVGGAAAFRTAVEEATAAANPSDELPDGLAALRDAALAEHRAGGSEAWR